VGRRKTRMDRTGYAGFSETHASECSEGLASPPRRDPCRGGFIRVHRVEWFRKNPAYPVRSIRVFRRPTRPASLFHSKACHRTRRRTVIKDAAIVGPGKSPPMAEITLRITLLCPIFVGTRKDAGIDPAAARRRAIILQGPEPGSSWPSGTVRPLILAECFRYRARRAHRGPDTSQVAR